ncbi:TPA-induced transmembrane protein isoform 2-T2 [Mantella aurantiaca]
MDSEQNNNALELLLVPNNQNAMEENRLQKKTENAPKSHKKNFFKKPKFWIPIIFLLFVLVTIISLVLYSNVYEDEDEKHFISSRTNNTCTFTGLLNLTNPCLWAFWEKNEKTFQDRIYNVYEKSPSLQYYFIDASIDYNSTNKNKSAIIKLEFTSPSKNSEYSISTELVEGILRQDLYELDHSACLHSNALLNAFKVTSMSL